MVTHPAKASAEMRKMMREAKDTAEDSRGHWLRPWYMSGNQHTAISVCYHCDASVTVREHPLPNQSAIVGDAVAVHCSEAEDQARNESRMEA